MGVTNDRLSEISIKLKRIRNFMKKNNYAGVLFLTQHNFSWITGGGDNSIIHGLEEGFVNALITKDKGFIVTNNIEMPRVVKEECEGLGLEALEYNWTEDNRQELIRDIIGGWRRTCLIDTVLLKPVGSIYYAFLLKIMKRAVIGSLLRCARTQWMKQWKLLSPD